MMTSSMHPAFDGVHVAHLESQLAKGQFPSLRDYICTYAARFKSVESPESHPTGFDKGLAASNSRQQLHGWWVYWVNLQPIFNWKSRFHSSQQCGGKHTIALIHSILMIKLEHLTEEHTLFERQATVMSLQKALGSLVDAECTMNTVYVITACKSLQFQYCNRVFCA